MRGNFLITLGAALIIAGPILLFIGYDTENPGLSAFAWALIIGGIVSLVFGVMRKVNSVLTRPENSEEAYAHAEIRMLIQSMGEMAAADGRIDPKEIETIASIHERMLGVSISHTHVKSILREFHESDNVRKKLHDDRKLVSPSMKRMIIQSCYLVMMADDDLDTMELERLYEIGDVLGFSNDDVKNLVSLAQT